MPPDFPPKSPESLACAVCGSTEDVRDRRDLPPPSWHERIVSEDPLAPPPREGLALLLCPECARKSRDRLFQQLYTMMF